VDSRTAVMIWICGFPLGLAVGYFSARTMRDHDLVSDLFGSTSKESSKWFAPEITYRELFPSSRTTLWVILCTIVKDYATAFVWIIVGVYFVTLGGGFVIMYPFVIERRIERLLTDYETSGTKVVGKIVTVYTSNTEGEKYLRHIKVLYDAATLLPFQKRQYYERILQQRNTQAHLPFPIIDEKVDLYLLGPEFPCSARLSSEITQRHERRNGLIFIGLFVIAWQTISWAIPICISTVVPTSTVLITALLCQLLLGYVACCIRFRYIWQDMVHGAKPLIMDDDNDETTDKASTVTLSTLEESVDMESLDRVVYGAKPLIMNDDDDDDDDNDNNETTAEADTGTVSTLAESVAMESSDLSL